jgi:hypothetical protein
VRAVIPVLRFGALALVLALSGAAYAQTADIPEPAGRGEAGAWFEQYIDADGWTVLGRDDAAVALASPDGATRLADGTLQVTVRHEYYRQRDFGGYPTRSIVQTRIIDCVRGVHRTTSMTLFERSHMQGDSVSRENANAEWTTPSENSLYLTAARGLCLTERLNGRL